VTFRDRFAEGEWYHCYNRGVDKRVLFKVKRDYERFLMLLYLSNSTKSVHLSNLGQGLKQGPTLPLVLEVKREDPLVYIGAYSLMPNHFHILFKASDPKEASRFMQKIATGYSMYFNKKYIRTGTLFEGRFKSRRIDSDIYFKRLLNYIHANPAELFEPGWKKGVFKNEDKLKKYLSEYEFSSLPEYLEINRPLSNIIDKQKVIDMLEKPYSLENLLEEARIFIQLKSRSDLA
jgi:hypothetical protein